MCFFFYFFKLLSPTRNIQVVKDLKFRPEVRVIYCYVCPCRQFVETIAEGAVDDSWILNDLAHFGDPDPFSKYAMCACARSAAKAEAEFN